MLAPPVLPRLLARVSRTSSLSTVIFLLNERALQPIAFFTHLVLLDQACAHCPKFPTAASLKKFGPCLSPNVADHSFKPAKDSRLGELLPTN